MQGSWLDPLDDLKQHSMVLVTDNIEYHLRTPGTSAYCDVHYAEWDLITLAEAEADENLDACHTCFPPQTNRPLPPGKEDERQMRMFD